MNLELSEKIEVFCRDTGSGAQAPITVEGRRRWCGGRGEISVKGLLCTDDGRGSQGG